MCALGVFAKDDVVGSLRQHVSSVTAACGYMAGLTGVTRSRHRVKENSIGGKNLNKRLCYSDGIPDMYTLIPTGYLSYAIFLVSQSCLVLLLSSCISQCPRLFVPFFSFVHVYI
jgi:hypothetical protein